MSTQEIYVRAFWPSTKHEQPMRLEAEVFGHFAVLVFPTAINDCDWSVTHIPSGLAAASARTREQAIAAADAFMALPIDWQFTVRKRAKHVHRRHLAAIEKIRADARADLEPQP